MAGDVRKQVGRSVSSMGVRGWRTPSIATSSIAAISDSTDGGAMRHFVCGASNPRFKRILRGDVGAFRNESVARTRGGTQTTVTTSKKITARSRARLTSERSIRGCLTGSLALFNLLGNDYRRPACPSCAAPPASCTRLQIPIVGPLRTFDKRIQDFYGRC
jgi:hypothetical protein